jgi:hypothetical protein
MIKKIKWAIQRLKDNARAVRSQAKLDAEYARIALLPPAEKSKAYEDRRMAYQYLSGDIGINKLNQEQLTVAEKIIKDRL